MMTMILVMMIMRTKIMMMMIPVVSFGSIERKLEHEPLLTGLVRVGRRSILFILVIWNTIGQDCPGLVIHQLTEL